MHHDPILVGTVAIEPNRWDTLDPSHAPMTHPLMAKDSDRLTSTVQTLRSQGFEGSWTLEFVAGLLNERDEPDALVAQAAADLPILRDARS